jgi:glucose-6-phosphate 1-dehydrogenase
VRRPPSTWEYRRLARGPLPDAYENVFAEVLERGHSVFPGPGEIERSWGIVDPLIRCWERQGGPLPYARGSRGPGEADALVAGHRGGRWITSVEEPVLSASRPRTVTAGA